MTSLIKGRKSILLSELLSNDFLACYHINSQVTVNRIVTKAKEFDIDDVPGPVRVLTVGSGKFTLKDNKGELEIINYEDFINQCKQPPSFLQGRKKCDFVIVSDQSHILLLEITSARGSVQNLGLPISNPRTGVVTFPGGKYEKVEYQLSESLQTMMQVVTINRFVNQMRFKTALMAYKVISPSVVSTLGVGINIFSRYLSIEALETQENGALLSCPQIEAYGFEYRRINHQASFHLQ